MLAERDAVHVLKNLKLVVAGHDLDLQLQRCARRRYAPVVTTVIEAGVAQERLRCGGRPSK